jgi:hypothetical protein
VDVRKPVWTSASFLLYTGGLVVLSAALTAYGFLAASYGAGAFAGWALLVLAVLCAIALAFRRRGRWIAAGIFAFASVAAWAVFVGALWVWWGWLGFDDVVHGPLHGFSVARLSLLLLVLVAAIAALARFRFPFIAAILVAVAWLFVTDLVSGGGYGSATVTFALGLVYLAIGGASGGPSAFWFHVGSGVLIGGALLYWWNGRDWTWWLVVVVALLYVALARGTGRSSWAVLGAAGLLAAASHFAADWSHGGVSAVPGFAPFVPTRGWVPPLVYAFTGFLLVALGLALARRRAE